MTSVLYIEESVVTGEILAGAHSAEREVCVNETAIVTPTGWDFLRNARLRLIRGSASKKTVSLRAVEKKTDEHMMDGLGRCNQPERSCGCVDEEFGSGFAESNFHGDGNVYKIIIETLIKKLVDLNIQIDPEQLIREVTAVVTKRLER